jgi:hypothetical protein
MTIADVFNGIYVTEMSLGAFGPLDVVFVSPLLAVVGIVLR